MQRLVDVNESYEDSRSRKIAPHRDGKLYARKWRACDQTIAILDVARRLFA
jgi:hypothetical protein